TKNFLNPNCRIYQEIAKISNLTDDIGALKYGRMYIREISGDGQTFNRPQNNPCTLAFSRILADQEALIAYNTSTTDARNDFVIVDAQIQKDKKTMTFRYDSTGVRSGQTINVQARPDSSRCVQLDLQPMQFVVLS
ncbi:MAG TPA: hypothetical protein VKK61_09325, partial [Tepidisphaeraceae bacterium]|nr:hypothetical protein [Tepidisphaeraceae bacterium]